MRLPLQVVLLPILLFPLTLNGCSNGSRSTATAKSPAGSGGASEEQVAPDALLDSAVQILQAAKRSPSAHLIAAQRLNQYLAKARSTGGFPIATLNSDLKSALSGRLTQQQIQMIELDQFDRTDSIHLESCFLLRDATRRVIEGKRDKASKALAVFDWVVRNVQLVPPEESQIPMAPPMTVLIGRGIAAERAWTFMELLRQADIESVLLAIMQKSPDGKQTVMVPWLPAAFWNDSLYLFDTTLGLPVPGPENRPVATFKEVLADPSLLEQLSLGDSNPYRVQANQLASVLVLIESSPMYWSPRMRFLQGNLTGDQHVVLWSDLLGLTERVRLATSEDTAQDLWQLPKAEHELSFKREYTEAILGNRENPIGVLTAYQFFSCAEARTAHLQGKWSEAIPLYMSNRVPFESWLMNERNQVGMRAVVANAFDPSGTSPEVAREISSKVAARVSELYESIREDCTYFPGLAKFEQKDYPAAIQWLAKSYLEKYPNGRWVPSVRFHLARCAEEQHDVEKAIQYYVAEDVTAQAPGNLIRARRLGWKPQEAAEPADKTVSSSPSQAEQ